MKLNYKRTFFVGLAFMSICSFWQLYDNIIPLILKNTFKISDTVSGVLMAADNVLALFMLPFFGMVHVAYLPDEKIIGLSKIPRIVDMYARRLQVQERLTTQIMEAIEEILQPKGCGVLIEASHLCAMMRGVKKDQAKLITTNFSGLFLKDESIRSDFVNQVNQESVKV